MPDVVQAVAQVLAAPPLIVCRPHLQPGILVGTGNLPFFAQPEFGLSYGGIFTAQAVPPELGRTSEPFPVYDLPLLTLYFKARLTTGLTVVDRVERLHQVEEVVRWFSFPYAAIQYQCLPGCTFVFSYLLLH